MNHFNEKIQAFFIHLLSSAFIVCSFFAYMYFIAYTPDIFILEGGLDITLLLVMVDLVLGPALTFVVYKKGKPKLLMDLSFIICLQLSAFAYGAWVLYSERPAYLSFVNQQFEVISAKRVVYDENMEPSLKVNCLSGPKLIYIEDPGASLPISVFNGMLDGKPGIVGYQVYMRDFSSNYEGIKELRISLEDFSVKNSPLVVEALNTTLSQLNVTQDSVAIYPLKSALNMSNVILDYQTGKLLGYFSHQIIH